MRNPAVIQPFYVNEKSEFIESEFLELLDRTVKIALNIIDKPGILLSGGVDSALLAIIAAKHFSDIPCFVVGQHIDHPDVQAAIRLAEEKSLNLYIHLLNKEETSNVQKELEYSSNLMPITKGDVCVYAALKFVASIVPEVIATDGIDELMGGYWGHRDREKFPDIRKAFEYFWDELKEKHLSPMCRSVDLCELKVLFIYLVPGIIHYLSRIPLEKRIEGNVGKAAWKKIALNAGVPQWVIDRQKLGFCDAFN